MLHTKGRVVANKGGAELIVRRPFNPGANRVDDDEELLNYARGYFQAAAQSTERRKMQILVKLGLEYLKLAAQAERTRVRQRRATLPKPDRAPRASGRSDATD